MNKRRSNASQRPAGGPFISTSISVGPMQEARYMLVMSDGPPPATAFARNLNVAGVPALAAEPVVARNLLHHGPRWPSRLLLPLLNRARSA